jgi:hypothetical protein
LKEIHPKAFEDAKKYEKDAMLHGSPFTWNQGETLTELEEPSRVAQIKADYEHRKERLAAAKRPNPLRVLSTEGRPEDIDDLYGEDEGGGSCLICHK